MKELEDFWHILGCVLPGHVSHKNFEGTVNALGQLSHTGSRVVYGMTACRSIFYGPDLVQAESSAREQLAVKVFHMIWTGVKSWFRVGWGAPSWASFGDPPDARLSVAMDRDLPKLYLVARCQGTIDELDPRLYCHRLEYEARLAAVRQVHHLIADFFADTSLDGDTVVGGQWGRRNEVVIRSLCIGLLKAIGYGESEGLVWCTTAPICAA